MTVDEVSEKRSRRDDPALDTRRLIAFFVGLVVAYGGAILVLRPGEGDVEKIATPLMFAPTIGALAAVLFARGRIQFGRPTKHLLLAFVPPAIILATTWIVATFTDVEVHPDRLLPVLGLSVVAGFAGALTAIGEEIGWRGFLWPLFRRHRGFWVSALIMLPIWLVYHLPAVLWGYGFVGGLPAFTVAIFGFILFVGVLTERSRGVWASVLAHGAWNGTVATAYFASMTGEAIPVCGDGGCPDFAATGHLFSGSQTLLGEFGWIAAVTMLAVGVVAALWHLRNPVAPSRASD